MQRHLTAFRFVVATLALTAALHVDATTEGARVNAARERVEEQNRRFIADAFNRWAAGGTRFFDEVLADDVAWTIEGSGPAAGTYRGRSDFMERAVRPFATRMKKGVRPMRVDVWADGEHVIANWYGEGVAGDGQPYRNGYAWIFRMREGKAVEVKAFLDLAPYDDVIRRVPARGGVSGAGS